MKKLQQKDKQNRKFTAAHEVKKLILRSVVKNSNFSILTKLKSYKLLFEMSIKSSKIRHVNRCILTGRKKRINRLYSFSRISFFKLARNGYISGLKKSSW